MVSEENLLQEQANGIFFAESEITPLIKAFCEVRGIQLNVIPDNLYEETIAMGFGEWLIKNNG